MKRKVANHIMDQSGTINPLLVHRRLVFVFSITLMSYIFYAHPESYQWILFLFISISCIPDEFKTFKYRSNINFLNHLNKIEFALNGYTVSAFGRRYYKENQKIVLNDNFLKALGYYPLKYTTFFSDENIVPGTLPSDSTFKIDELKIMTLDSSSVLEIICAMRYDTWRDIVSIGANYYRVNRKWVKRYVEQKSAREFSIGSVALGLFELFKKKLPILYLVRKKLDTKFGNNEFFIVSENELALFKIAP